MFLVLSHVRFALTKLSIYGLGLFALAALLLLASCKKEEEKPLPAIVAGQEVTFPLLINQRDNFSGSIILRKTVDGFTRAQITISGFDKAKRYAAAIEFGNAADLANGTALADLNEINTATGTSETYIFENQSSQPLLYDSLIIANARVLVYEFVTGSTSQQTVLLGDIGINTLTGLNRSYTIIPAQSGSGVAGTILVSERRSGQLLIETRLTGITENKFLPFELRRGDPADFNLSTRVLTLNSIPTTSPRSYATFPARINGIPVTLASLDTTAAFFAIGASQSQQVSDLLAYANLGGNANTGQRETINLVGSDSTIRATIQLSERLGAVRAEVIANGLPSGQQYYITFHNGTAQANTLSYYYKIGPFSDTANRIVVSNIILENGTRITSIADLESIDASLRFGADTQTFTNLIATADIGKNTITNERKIVPLQPVIGADPQIIGEIQLIKRRSGATLAGFYLSNSTGFSVMPVLLREGSYQNTTTAFPGTILFALTNELFGIDAPLKSKYDLKLISGMPINFSEFSTMPIKHIIIGNEDTQQALTGGTLP
jgi:hypothetical protein